METHQWHMQILTIYYLFVGNIVTNIIVKCIQHITFGGYSRSQKSLPQNSEYRWAHIHNITQNCTMCRFWLHIGHLSMIAWPVLSYNAYNTSYLTGIVRTKRVYLRIPSISECTYMIVPMSQGAALNDSPHCTISSNVVWCTHQYLESWGKLFWSLPIKCHVLNALHDSTGHAIMSKWPIWSQNLHIVQFWVMLCMCTHQ